MLFDITTISFLEVEKIFVGNGLFVRTVSFLMFFAIAERAHADKSVDPAELIADK